VTQSIPALGFEVGGRSLSLPAVAIREVLRSARLTRVPNSPPSLLGLANLKGVATPILSAARLLGLPPGPETRLIVVERSPSLGLAVDHVDRFTHVDQKGMIDIEALLASVGSGPAQPPSQRGTRVRAAVARSRRSHRLLLPFRLGHQRFALPLASIAEVLVRPAAFARFPHADPAVAGSVAWRNQTLPVLELSTVLGLPDTRTATRLLVVDNGEVSVGLLVEAVDPVLRVPDSDIDPLPVILSKRAAATTIEAIARIGVERELISIMSPQLLLGGDRIARLGVGKSVMAPIAARPAERDRFVFFTLGSERFGLPIDLVREVTRTPAHLTTVPRAPAFLLGLFNLHGQILPLIDLGERLGSAATTGGRVIILRFGDLVAGLLVDRIHGIEQATPVPAMSTGNGEAVLANIIAGEDGKAANRILDLRHLLPQAAQDILAITQNRPRARLG
jgi:purine-binding chemotaxis protein CheW